MLAKDWFPNTKAALLAFYQTLLLALPGIATRLGLDADLTEAALAAARKFVAARQAVDALRKKLKAAIKTLEAQDKASESTARALAKTLRGYPGITPALLADLGLSETETATAATLQARAVAHAPVLKLRLGAGRVRVAFVKHGHQGIHLFCRRGTETEFTFLGASTYAPYLDNRPNLLPGQAEQRDYYAFFMDHDHPHGAQSATFSIAVPA